MSLFIFDTDSSSTQKSSIDVNYYRKQNNNNKVLLNHEKDFNNILDKIGVFLLKSKDKKYYKASKFKTPYDSYNYKNDEIYRDYKLLNREDEVYLQQLSEDNEIENKLLEEDKLEEDKLEEDIIKIFIKSGMSSLQVSKLLEDVGIIKDHQDFNQYLKNQDATKKIWYGKFDLMKDSKYEDILKKIAH